MGPGATDTSVTGETVSQSTLSQLLSYLWGHCCQEAGVLYATFPVAARFSEAVGSVAAVRGRELQEPILLLPRFCLLCVSQPTHFYMYLNGHVC